MIYGVSAPNLANLRLNETNTVASVLQNIAVILATPKGTVPMYRDFGIEMDYLDLPLPEAPVKSIPRFFRAIQVAWMFSISGLQFFKTRQAFGIRAIQSYFTP